MAERLSSLAYANSNVNASFNPRSVSLDIRSPEELAAVNHFLLTLGRDVVSAQESRLNSNTQPYNYFDYEQLSHLGLTGMPGIPTPATGHSSNAYTNAGGQHSSQTALYTANPSMRAGQPLASTASYGGLYPSVHDLANPSLFSATNIERRMSNDSNSGGGIALPPPTSSTYAPTAHQQPSTISHMRPTPPLDSPHSSLSSPSSSTPPHPHQKDTAAVYDRNSRRVVPPAILASADYSSKSMRSIVPLKTVPALNSSPDHSEPSSSRQSSPTHPSSPTTSSLARALYPHIKPGDDDLKLPPLHRHYPSLSPPSSPAREHAGPVLPSLREVTASAAPASGVEERLSRRLDGLKLSGRSNDDRARHAALIRDLLMTINDRYRAQFAPAPPVPNSPASTVHDVEMPAARG